jgi:hypothetical protein
MLAESVEHPVRKTTGIAVSSGELLLVTNPDAFQLIG